MQTLDQPTNQQESDQESPPPSLEEGYAITILVTKDGYDVHGPDPLPAEPQSEERADEETMAPDLTTAIKHVLAIVKAHPVGQDEQAGFKSATASIGR